MVTNHRYREPTLSLQDVRSRLASAFDEVDVAQVENALHAVALALDGYDASIVPADDLYPEFEAMKETYRAVRAADARMQAQRRQSEVGDLLTRCYYRLRSLQAALSMAYSVAGPLARRPDMSPLSTAIGMYDAPKVLAQETHLASGSYDATLPHFVRWMQEIWEDIRVRSADYARFYGDEEVDRARAALRRILGLSDDGVPRLLDLHPGGADDPLALRLRLEKWASDDRDLIAATRAIQAAGHQARMSLISLLAQAPAYGEQLGPKGAVEAEQILQAVLQWRYPVGDTLMLDLAVEQAAFDELLARVPLDPAELRLRSEPWDDLAVNALRRACFAEQSVRDHIEAHQAQLPDARSVRRFRWYIWEFLNLVDQTAGPTALGAHPAVAFGH
ncbi:MAG: hypothetical protein HW416_1828 [Chloroflexi bacterium]|nr:hypothetical protein [Chloroflexota bacterium]